ncbi:unnamed protein product [Owenia fusiformis]|nr:unnamed protein product [Owenia fusiformis]
MDSIFPDGLQKFYDATGWPVSAHNRWWSPKTTYAKQNGGDFNFIVEAKKAIPVDMGFWDYLMRESKKWGLVNYEQDWLDVEFGGLNATLTDINLGRTWLHQMGKAAQENGLTIQYCMSNPRHILQSLEIPVVTQARVSDDYHPGNSQWKIGISSMFANALGYAPFKDNFWTTTVQPGTSYNQGAATEPNVELQTTVAILSTGPVGPSDKNNYTDIDLLMRCCANDGLILKPSRPAIAINDQILMNAWGNPIGEVWSTYSDIAGWRFGIILAAEMLQDYTIGPMAAGFGDDFPKSKIFGSTKTMEFSETSKLLIPAKQCTTKTPCVYWTTPVFTINGDEILIIGELDKTVRMSPQRVTNINVTPNDIEIHIKGSYQESVRFVYTRNGHAFDITCVLPMSGKTVIDPILNMCIND